MLCNEVWMFPDSLSAGPNPTLVSPAAKSPYVAVTGISAKEGSQFYEAVIAIKSIPGTSATPCQKG